MLSSTLKKLCSASNKDYVFQSCDNKALELKKIVYYSYKSFLESFFFLNISSAIFNILRIVFDHSKGFFEGETAGRGKEKMKDGG